VAVNLTGNLNLVGGEGVGWGRNLFSFLQRLCVILHICEVRLRVLQFCTLSEIAFACNIVTRVTMNYFTAFRTDDISYLTFVHPVAFQNPKINHSALKTESLSTLR
jgi:hypothetical protein